MRTIGNAVRMGALVAVFLPMVLQGISYAAEHGGMSGVHQGDHGGMKMEGHGGMSGKRGARNLDMGEKIFFGRVGPWTAEARLVDMKAQMERSGVSAGTAARFAGRRHLMLFLTDPKTGKPVAGVGGKVAVTGPDKASSSTITLIVMGEHIGSDVNLQAPGEYTFKAELESGGQKGNATFTYTLK